MANNQSNPAQAMQIESPSRLRQLAGLPIAVFLLAMAALWIADLRVAWPLPFLFWLVHYGSVALGVGFIVIPAARSFLANGQPSVLMLGCGILMMDVGVTAMPSAFARSSDAAFAIYNTSALLAALCHFAGVTITARRKIRLRRLATWLTAAYAGGMAAMGLVIWGAFAGWMPVFFIDGQGGTLLRSLVVGMAVALFLLTAGLLWQTSRRALSPFLYWYALGLVLLAAGLAGSMAIAVRDSPLQWVARVTQVCGTVYMCVAVVASARERGAGVIPLASVEEAWREKWFLPGLRQHAPLWWALRYGLAVGAVAVAIGLRLALEARFGPGLPPYITFYPAIMVVALLAGLGPCLVAMALAGFVVSYWFLPRIGQFPFASPVDRLGLVVFTGMGVFMGVVAELYRSYRHKSAAYDRETALRESQARLATFAAATFEGIVESEGGRIKDCNVQLERMLGYTLAELRGMEIVNLVAPEDRDRVVENIRRGQESMIEHVMLRKDGTRMVVEAHGRPLFADGETRLTALRDITERREAESKLQDTLQRFYHVLSSMYSGVLLMTDEGRIEFVNQAFCDAYGLKEAPAELVGLASHDLLQKILPAFAQPDQAAARIQEILQRGEPVRVEGFAMQGGRTALRDFVPLSINGKPRGRLWIYTDITERKRAEEALRESRERLDLALVSSRMATFDWDIVTNRRTWSTGVHALLGTKPETFTGTAEEFFKVIHPEDQGTVQAALERAVEGTGEYETEYRAVWPDGSIHHISARGKVHHDQAGRAVLMTGVCWDITERKRAEEALRESEVRYRSLFTTIDAGFCVIEMLFDGQGRPVDYRFLEINAAFEKQTGLHDAQGRLMRELAPAHETHWFEIYGKIAITGDPLHFVNEARALNRWYDVYAYRVGEPESRQVAILFNDISEHKRAEDELRQRAEELRAANEELTRFNRVTVGRELRVIELKKQVNDLCARFGQPPRYAPEPDEKAQPTP